MKNLIGLLCIGILFFTVSCTKKQQEELTEQSQQKETDEFAAELVAKGIKEVEFVKGRHIPQAAYIDMPTMGYEFRNNIARYWRTADSPLGEAELLGTYYLQNVDGIDFINFQWENNQNERYLILYGTAVCYLYESDSPQFFEGYRTRRGYPGENIQFVDDAKLVQIKASSYLNENGIEYTPQKMNTKIGDGNCWVEGAAGQGIGETFTIKYMSNYLPIETIHISIGYVSHDKPHLYKQNSRPKKIELSVADKYAVQVDLEDTPNFQAIRLPKSLAGSEELAITILDVYEGTRYEDTCINMLLLDTRVD